MKKLIFLLAAGIFCSSVFAERQLDKMEISNILTELTKTPTKSWITVGTIKALHEEYRAPQTTDSNKINLDITQELEIYKNKANKIQNTEKLQAMRTEAIPFNIRYKLSNDYTMKSTVVVNVDGEKFYWQTNVNSRTDSIKKPDQLKGNFLTDEFNLESNEEKIFSWDGQKYITYFKPVNHAIISKERGKVNGPLTAGFIPWGYGNYTFQSLSQADITGIENQTDGQKQIQLSVHRKDGTEETFLFDPGHNYAVKQYSAHLLNNIFVLRVYDGYKQIGDNWCPDNILIERYDTSKNPHRLLARDIWNFTSVEEKKPSATDFEVSYDIDAYIEDFCFGTEPLQYRYSAPQPPLANKIDTDELMSLRLIIASASDKQNCATASLKYVCDNLGLNCNKSFGGLVNDKGNTTVFQMKQFAESLNLNTYAVKTDLQTLKNLTGYQVILHLPIDNHFAVLGDLDDKYVRLIDLSSNNFYRRYAVEGFNSIWDGTVLLVSKNPVKLAGSFKKIDKSQLNKILGASDCLQCNTSCSNSGNFPCSGSPPYCGSHTIYYSRTCCGSATSGS